MNKWQIFHFRLNYFLIPFLYKYKIKQYLADPLQCHQGPLGVTDPLLKTPGVSLTIWSHCQRYSTTWSVQSSFCQFQTQSTHIFLWFPVTSPLCWTTCLLYMGCRFTPQQGTASLRKVTVTHRQCGALEQDTRPQVAPEISVLYAALDKSVC